MRQRGVSRAHVNYPNICIWASLQKKKKTPTTSTTQFQFHPADNCQFGRECKFCQYPPSILPLSHMQSYSLSLVCLPWMTCFEGGKEGGDPFSKFTVLVATPAVVIAPYLQESDDFFLFWADREEEKRAMLDVTASLRACVCAYVHKTKSNWTKRAFTLLTSSSSGFSFLPPCPDPLLWLLKKKTAPCLQTYRWPLHYKTMEAWREYPPGVLVYSFKLSHWQ